MSEVRVEMNRGNTFPMDRELTLFETLLLAKLDCLTQLVLYNRFLTAVKQSFSESDIMQIQASVKEMFNSISRQQYQNALAEFNSKEESE